MMNYIEVVDLIFKIIPVILGVLAFQFVFFAVVGIFAKKKFPKADKKLKYGIVIAARNEESVIENLILSVQKNEYPQDKLQIFVVAHNCNDKTAEIARTAGATVYEYNNPKERTKGYAFKYLFQKIEEDYGTQNYDGFFVLDADNLLSQNYFDKMNDAYVYYKGERVVTSFRNSKNFGTNVMSACYGLFFMFGCRMGCRGASVCGCSTRVSGTGFVFNSNIVKQGWNYVTLTEDLEFSADQVLQGCKIAYCDDAVCYDEQPTKHNVMLRQRLRWAKGHLLVTLSKTKKLFKQLFKRTPKGEKNIKFSTYGMLFETLPIYTITSFVFILNWILILLTPLFMPNYLQIWQSHIYNLGWTILEWYSIFAVSAVMLFLLEHKRIHKFSFFKKILAVLYFPVFMFLQFPLEVFALFLKVDWKTVAHNDTTSFEKINQISNKNMSQEINETVNSETVEK